MAREKKVAQGNCAICGKPVYRVWEDEEGALYGGWMQMSFGYGSVHDCQMVKTLIHDICAEQLFSAHPKAWIINCPLGNEYPFKQTATKAAEAAKRKKRV
jgi:hypothetical protein